MGENERMILVVDARDAIANNLKELIEFMDAPRVCIALPGQWRERLGENRLEAVFVDSDLASTDMEELLDGVGKMDPNVPIVMMNVIEPK